jgi:hypothetical protein
MYILTYKEMAIFLIMILPIFVFCCSLASAADSVGLFRKRYKDEQEILKKHDDIFQHHIREIGKDTNDIGNAVISCMNEILLAENLRKLVFTSEGEDLWDNSIEVPEILKKLKKTIKTDFEKRKYELEKESV